MKVKPFRPRYAQGVASLPDWVKPETGDEAMGKRSRRTSRGERVQRAGTDQPRNLGDPAGERRGDTKQLPAGINNRGGSCRESERPIVAGKSGNADGAKGPC
jgi:hypothetical protein